MKLKQELVNVAKILLEEKSLKDDVKAANDIERIEEILNEPVMTDTLYNEAVVLDQERIGNYPEIEELCSAAVAMQKALGIRNERRISQPENIAVQNLITDMFGIYASVLLKHQKIDCIKEFIDSV